MYRTCLFCHADLGANREIEALPIGRRLAFDQPNGRLWVVCRRCERWNLTPFDERWEAIEACEKAYRDTSRRFGTDHIGLARLAEGLELVRIGAPLRPEFAAWRYGDQFGRRRRRNALLGAAATTAVVGLVAAPWLAGIAGIGTAFQLLSNSWIFYWSRRTSVTIDGPDQRPIHLVPAQVANAQLARDPQSDQPILLVPHRIGTVIIRTHGQGFHRLEGDAALRAAGRILPKVNATGGSRRVVSEAARLLDGLTDPTTHFATLAKRVAGAKFAGQRELGRQPKELSLALEMAAHEETERVWLAGELLELEAAWRDAESLAKIADTLGLPERLDDQLHQLKDREKP
ncbi:MAG: hypothetical protein ACKVZ0_19920 [Gemmatimonadales bacterium]